MEQLEKQLGYTFKDKDKLLLAMTTVHILQSMI